MHWRKIGWSSRSVLRSLRGSLVGGVPSWMQQLDLMEHNGVKAEIEAAYVHSGFGNFARDLASRLAAHMYI